MRQIAVVAIMAVAVVACAASKDYGLTALTTTAASPPATVGSSAAPTTQTALTEAPTTTTATTSPTAAAASGRLSIAVSGTQFVDSQGAAVRLHGANRSGTEYMCTRGGGPFDGPSDADSINAMLSWHINAVRIPLNEQCWLGLNGLPATYPPAEYQQAIADYVALLTSKNIYPIIELHWSAPGTTQATGQTPMPDSDHSPAFWSSVADRFKENPAVIFDLFNEPYPDNNQSTTAAWTCWQNGGACANVDYDAAGMQTLVSAVRATGSTNVIVLSGIQYAGDTSQINVYKPTDPINQLAGSTHNYDTTGTCVTSTCWDSMMAGVGDMPFLTAELGTNSCTAAYPTDYMNWADARGVSYLGWAWNTYDCSGFPSLITDFDGTPTAFGLAFKQHYLDAFP